LDVTTYQPVNEKTQTFPPKETTANQATIPKQGEAKFKDYDKSLDFKARVLNAKKTSDMGLTVFLFKAWFIYQTKGSHCV